MTNFFTATGLGTNDISLRCLGGLSPALVNAAYPMEALTKFHYAHHIPGLTDCHNLPDDSRSNTPGGGSSRQCFSPSTRPICGIGSTDWRVRQHLHWRLLDRRIQDRCGQCLSICCVHFGYFCCFRERIPWSIHWTSGRNRHRYPHAQDDRRCLSNNRTNASI